MTRPGSLPGQGVGLTMRSLLAPDAQRDRRPEPRRRHDDYSDGSSEESAGARLARSRKQVKTLVLDPVPHASGFREWILALNTQVNAATRRPRVATMRWLNEVQVATSLSQVEGVSAKWEDLDAELADALLKVSSGPLKRELTLYQEEQQRRGLPLGGRAALWHVFQRFRLERGAAMCVDITALTSLEFRGDLEGFLAAWDRTLMALAKPPDEDLVHALFEQQVRKAKSMAPAFVLYDASPEGHENRTTAFLYASARAEILKNQREATRKSLMDQASSSLRAAPAFVGKGKDGKGKDGKGKDSKGKDDNNEAKDTQRRCFRFAKTGECKFGDECRFAHIAGGVCEQFKNGTCKFGDKCWYSHSL